MIPVPSVWLPTQPPLPVGVPAGRYVTPLMTTFSPAEIVPPPACAGPADVSLTQLASAPLNEYLKAGPQLTPGPPGSGAGWFAPRPGVNFALPSSEQPPKFWAA